MLFSQIVKFPFLLDDDDLLMGTCLGLEIPFISREMKEASLKRQFQRKRKSGQG